MRAACGGMESHLVRAHKVDRLHDVDFTVVRPERTLRPERGPYRTAVGKMDDVRYPKTAPIIEVGGLNTDLERSVLGMHTSAVLRKTNRVTKSAQRDVGGVVDLHNGPSGIVNVRQLLLKCCCRT